MFKKALAAVVLIVAIPIAWLVGKLDAIVLEGPDPYGDFTEPEEEA